MPNSLNAQLQAFTLEGHNERALPRPGARNAESLPAGLGFNDGVATHKRESVPGEGFEMKLYKRVVLDKELMPAEAFMNSLPSYNFLLIMERMIEGVGHDFHSIGSCVAEEDEDAPETGVKFYMGEDDTAWVSDDQLFEIFSQALQAHLADHPGDETVVRSLLERGRAKWIGA